jgi:hypothetical protein
MEREPVQLGGAVDEFVAAARRYCGFIEGGAMLQVAERLAAARTHVLHSYQAALALPDVEPPDGIEARPSPPRPSGWTSFGDLELYWEVFDPYENSKPVAGSLSDDLLDIYADVRRGLDLWNCDVPKEAAIWEWRFHLEAHWGDHAVDALRALHRACSRA